MPDTHVIKRLDSSSSILLIYSYYYSSTLQPRDGIVPRLSTKTILPFTDPALIASVHLSINKRNHRLIFHYLSLSNQTKVTGYKFKETRGTLLALPFLQCLAYGLVLLRALLKPATFKICIHNFISSR